MNTCILKLVSSTPNIQHTHATFDAFVLKLVLSKGLHSIIRIFSKFPYWSHYKFQVRYKSKNKRKPEQKIKKNVVLVVIENIKSGMIKDFDLIK